MKQSVVVLIAIGIGAVSGAANATSQNFTSVASLEFLRGQVALTKDSSERLAAFVDVIKAKCYSEAERVIFLSATVDERTGASASAETTRVANAKAELQRLEVAQARFFEVVEPALGSAASGVALPRRKQAPANTVLVEVVCHPK